MSNKICCATTIVLAAMLAGCASTSGTSESRNVDLLVRNGIVYDGRGGSPVAGDIAVVKDRIVAVGELDGYSAERSEERRVGKECRL